VVRLERGFFRFEPACRCTAPLPLGSYFRSILTSVELPADVEKQAPDSPFLRQYDFSTQKGPYRPAALPNTDLTDAFVPSDQSPVAVVEPGGGLAATSTPVVWPPTATPSPTSTPVIVGVTIYVTATPIGGAPQPKTLSQPSGQSQGAPTALINRAPADIVLRL